jgi:tetratricopeptide (TPR) repeat protein
MIETLILSAALVLPATPDDLATAREKLAAGEADAAAAMLQELLDKHEGDESEVRVLLAQAQVQAGSPKLAVDTLKPLLDGDDYLAQLTAGKAFNAWGAQMQAEQRKSSDTDFAFENAAQHLERAAKLAPAGNDEAAIALGYFEAYTKGDAAAAMKRADEILKKDGKNGEALLLRGVAGLQATVAAGNDEEAAAKARKQAIEDCVAADAALGGKRVEPWVQLQWLYEADGQPQKAVDAALATLDRAQVKDFGTLYHLAARYAGEQKFDASTRALQEMVKRDKAQFTEWLAADENKDAVALRFAWVTGPMVESQPPRFGEAYALLEPIVAADPQVADVWNNYGFVCRELLKHEDAYKAYDKALALDPNNPRLLNDLGVMLHYYLHRDYDRAEELYTKATEQADEQLQKPDLDATAKRDLEEAKKDAAGNLKKLAAKDYTWNG